MKATEFGVEHIHTNKDFEGYWHITNMDKWQKAAINLIGQAHILFDDDSMGKFQFIAVTGLMDCFYSVQNQMPFVEFSWQGNDERDETCGRGWAAIPKDGELKGHIFINCGEDSAFSGKKLKNKPTNNTTIQNR